MLHPGRGLSTVLVSAVSAVAIPACNGGSETPPTDTIAVVPSPALPGVASGTPATSGWDPIAGPVLLIAGGRSDAAILVFPEIQGEHAAAEVQFDTIALRNAVATVVDRAGTAATVVLGGGTKPGEDEDCVGWPMQHVAATQASTGIPAPWTVGFVGARLIPVALDSVGSLSVPDSAALVAEVTRLASTVPVHVDAASLRGLPFSVRDARRFRTADGVDAIVARVTRGVHQEATPLEERTLIIAERDSGQQQSLRSGGYTLAFHDRAVGREETLEGSEILGALVLQDTQRLLLIIARESEGGVRYVILERVAPRRWRVKWTSALVRC